MALRTLLLLFSLVGCGLCWRRHIPDVREDWPVMPRPGMEVEKSEANPILCEVCEVLVEEAQSLLGNDSKKVIALLDEVCALLPAPYNATCKEYVDEWTPIIIDFLENQTPEEVCQDLTLCSAAAVTRPETPRLGFGHLMRYLHKSFKKSFNKLMIRNALGNNFLCDGCNEVVTLLHDELTNQQILDELATLLAEGCSLCPVEAQCRAYFQNLPAEIAAFADQYLNNQTCKIIGLCTSGRDNPFNMFSRLFPGLIPDNFDGDFISGRPWSRPRPRPRPNTGPEPRRHPYRPYWDRHDGERRHNHSSEEPDMDGPDKGRRHDWHHHPHSGSRPEPREHPDRPDHHEPHDRPHHRPDGRDRPHHGPHHHPDRDMPRPDIRPWWKPDMRPYRPWGNKPALPEEPMIPEVEVPDTEIPDLEIPINDEIPNVEIPVNVEVPEFEIPNVEVPGVDFHPDPRNPFGPRPNRQGSSSGPRRNTWQKPDLANRKGASPAKPFWPNRGNRKQRSAVRINTIINTDFDQANTFDVEPTNEPMEKPTMEPVQFSWQCDVCEYEVEILQKYMEDNKDAINAKLLSLAALFCDRLPATSTAECKTEVADLLPPIVDMIIDTYLTPSTVCSALKAC
ncbi:uncharacterized protein LOC119731211 isoform X2 [Patiria miniata]|uniref:Saposin B-type domain-containing protein n=1 Tax=Patiria miniata TaxID=46514 RepID=A0A914A9Y5_PATMI|nr:uncharacterized protein LOC119731211 isoform X2 [Patiria miniata]